MTGDEMRARASLRRPGISVREAFALADLIDAARVSLDAAIHDDRQIHDEWGVGPYEEPEHITDLRDALAALEADQ